jgi:4-hydroxy-tetrahydrodipicolinate synthase
MIPGAVEKIGLAKRPLFLEAAPPFWGRNMFTGTYTAIVTPFKNGQLDEAALERLIKLQVKSGVDGIVPVGTTGESPTVDYDEHLRIIQLSVKFAAGKIKVVAGTGANSTKEAIYLTQHAEKLGADASLQVAPYYNKPTQEGLFQHFHAVARSTKLPIILYSIPGRCGVEIAVDTVDRLAHDSVNIVGIKEAGGNPDRVSQLRAALGVKFTILSGDDSLTLPFMSVGAHGVISVASNVVPREVAHMVKAYATGKTAVALKLHDKFYPLFKDLFLETNPVPVKAALAMMGVMQEEYRLPLVPMNSANRDKLAKTLKTCGVLK